MDDPNIITLIWLIVGILLSVSELIIPGLVILFFGMSAIIVAGIRWITGLESLPISFLLWSLISIVLVFSLRKMMTKLLPSEVHKGNIDQRIEAIGKEVEVIKTCNADSSEGRIRYQGTTWSATTLEGEIKAGEKATLYHRDNLVWLVEAVENLTEEEKLENELEQSIEESVEV